MYIYVCASFGPLTSFVERSPTWQGGCRVSSCFGLGWQQHRHSAATFRPPMPIQCPPPPPTPHLGKGHQCTTMLPEGAVVRRLGTVILCTYCHSVYCHSVTVILFTAGRCQPQRRNFARFGPEFVQADNRSEDNSGSD